jgi:hypothetical protein
VLEAAEENREAAAGSAPKSGRAKAAESFSREVLKIYFAKNVVRLEKAADKDQTIRPELESRLREIARALENSNTLLDAPGALDLEDLERHLTVLDEKLYAVLTSHAGEDLLLRIRREADGQLAPYRRKMKAEQLALVEKQYTQKRLLEEFGLPRLSLYFMP